MAKYDYDLFVIGAGSGGVRAARLASELNVKVGIAEEYRVGGTCVIRGCVPKKLLVYGSHYFHLFADAAAYGWTIGTPKFDWSTLIHHVGAEVDRLNGVYARVLDAAGVEVFLTRAALEGPHEVRLAENDKLITSDKILIATGGHPRIPDIPGKEHFISSNDCFKLEALPKRLAVLGAGYIGVEFASMFAGLGVEVTVIQRGPQILRGFDTSLSDGLAESLRDHGVDLVMDCSVVSIAREGEGLRLQLTDGDSLVVDKVLAATGRIPNTAGIGLEKAGVALGPQGQVAVNDYSRSSVENIYAVGDVTDRLNLTPIAIREAHAFVDTVFNEKPTAMDYKTVPTAVFTTPEVATVGLTEAEARAQFPHVQIYETRFTPLAFLVPKRAEKMMLKLIVDGKSDVVLGCHILGPDAAEIIQAVAIAVKNGLTKADFDATVALHPTAGEELVTMRVETEAPQMVAGSDAMA